MRLCEELTRDPDERVALGARELRWPGGEARSTCGGGAAGRGPVGPQASAGAGLGCSCEGETMPWPGVMGTRPPGPRRSWRSVSVLAFRFDRPACVRWRRWRRCAHAPSAPGGLEGGKGFSCAFAPVDRCRCRRRLRGGGLRRGRGGGRSDRHREGPLRPGRRVVKADGTVAQQTNTIASVRKTAVGRYCVVLAPEIDAAHSVPVATVGNGSFGTILVAQNNSACGSISLYVLTAIGSASPGPAVLPGRSLTPLPRAASWPHVPRPGTAECGASRGPWRCGTPSAALTDRCTGG